MGHRGFAVLAVAAWAAALCGVTPAGASAPITMVDLTQRLDALRQEGTDLDSELARLDGQSRANDELDASLKRRAAANKLEEQNLLADIRTADHVKLSLETEIEHYNTYCHGAFHHDEYHVRKAWCDANFAPLSARKKDGDVVAQLLRGRIGTLQIAMKNVNSDKIDLSRRTTALQENFREYDSQRRNWAQRLREVMQTPIFSELQRRADANIECANIPGAEAFERRLNGAAESAHRCLQKVWNGAN